MATHSDSKPDMTHHLATQYNEIPHGKPSLSLEHAVDLVSKNLYSKVLVILRSTPGIRDRNVRVSFEQNEYGCLVPERGVADVFCDVSFLHGNMTVVRSR